MLSETDDEIDDAWLIKRHHDTIGETEGLTRAEKSFRQRWNAHMISEGCPSGRYISDSLVRFTRENSAWLRGSDHELDMFIQYQNLTAKLMERGVIESNILHDCLRIIRNAREPRLERTASTNQDVPGLFLEGAPAAENRSTPGVSLDMRTDTVEGLRGMKTVDDENDKISNARGREDSKGMGVIQHPHRGNETATAISTFDSQAGSSFRVEQSRTSERKLHNPPANGFCGTCNNFIDRPKRNAITCSYSVSTVS